MANNSKISSFQNQEYVGVTFKCCKVYSRIYLNPERKKQIGWCPKCGAKMEIMLTPYGSKAKFFQTS